MPYKYSYPAVFTYHEEEKDMPFDVLFPDIIPGVTCGTSFDDAMYMAKDLLKLMLTTCLRQCFEPTSIKEVQKEYPGEMVIMVDIYLDEPIDESQMGHRHK